MRQPEDVADQVRTRFERDYPDWARGAGTWPLQISLKPPTVQERAEDAVACHAWAERWRTYAGPGTVAWASVRFPTGTHPMPKAVTIPGPREAAMVDRRCRQTWERCGQRLIALHGAFPEARFDRVIRKINDLTEDDYRRLADTAAWLRTHPTSGLLLRQLPIEGIDTKWLARHASLVLALLGDGEDTAADEAQAGDDAGAGPTSSRMRLHERLGLRIPPELIQVAVLDPALRADVAGMRHFAAAVDDLNRWRHQPHTVIILENKETGYAFTDDLPGTVVLHGQGFSILNYARITWVRNARTVIYWGDIDAPGLQFVNDLRALGVPARTVMMDTQTLQRFRHLSTSGAGPQRTALAHLTGPELDLYLLLSAHAAKHGTGLLLEQERIPWPHARQELAHALGHGAAPDGATPA
jgi:hypothetical protein